MSIDRYRAGVQIGRTIERLAAPRQHTAIAVHPARNLGAVPMAQGAVDLVAQANAGLLSAETWVPDYSLLASRGVF